MLRSLVCFGQANIKKSKNLTNTVNIDEKNFHIFRKSWEISMKFLGKMDLMVILKVIKKSRLWGGWGGVKLTSPAV